MYRLLYLSCAMALFWNLDLVCAQERAFVPVTITLQAPSALGTATQPMLDVHTSELDVATGDGEAFFVSLNSAPTGSVPVSLRVIDAPPDGDPDDLILSSLSFTPTNYSEAVTVVASSGAKEGKYIIELTAVIGKVRDTKTITVIVKKDFEFLSISDIEMRPGDTRRKYVQLRLKGEPRWGTIPVTISIREDVGTQIRIEPATLTFTKENHDTPQPITVTAMDNAVKGDYTLVVSNSRDGYNDVLEEVPIRILSKSCSINTRIVSGHEELNFGTWTKPGPGWGWIATLDANTGRRTGIMIDPIGNEATLGKYAVTLQSCNRICHVSVQVIFGRRGLRGQSTSHTLRLGMHWVRQNPDGTIVDQKPIDYSTAWIRGDGDYNFTLGGRIRNYSGSGHNTPSDTYIGRIFVNNICPP